MMRTTFPLPATPPADQERVPPTESSPLPPKPVGTFKPTEQAVFHEKPAFIAKPIPHSPKISPSSIPNPNPSASAAKPMEPGYPNFGSYLYSIPGYSAFQRVSYPGAVQTNHEANICTNITVQNEVPQPELVSFAPKESIVDGQSNKQTDQQSKVEDARPQTDFEDNFTTEIIPTVSVSETEKSSVSKLSITSLIQGSGATVTIPSQIPCKDLKKKPTERFSLKTSIPISKIDMKCVSNPPDTMFQNAINKKPAIQTPNVKIDTSTRVEIQSNIVIKTATVEPEHASSIKPAQTTGNNNINTLINAAEAISKSENQSWNTEEKGTANEMHESAPAPAPVVSSPQSLTPVFNSINIEPKVNFSNKPPPDGTFNDQKNQILFIQNKNPSNPKMLLTIQQQNPQVLLQRTSFESKNLQAPSRLSNQIKKSKEDIVGDSTASKVVALKRMHQENCDENDFENLITENQIYGNKIVVKEKSQGTQQEQDLKNNNKVTDKQIDTKNVVLQPNFLYLSNVQFPANLMMIKNNTKIAQTNDSTKVIVTSNESKLPSEVNTITNTSVASPVAKSPKTQSVVSSKDIHVLKSSNNVLQTISNKNNKTDLVFQTNQKVIMSPQLVYQVPMIVDTDNKLNHRDYPKFLGQKVEYSKPLEQKPNDKLYIACPYQMDSKLQPKIVITNIRPKVTKIDEISSLDIYEKRKRMRRLKYLSNRENKEGIKPELKKGQDKHDNLRDIITPDKMEAEICKEFVNTKVITDEGGSDSESDYGEEEIKEYASILKTFGNEKENNNRKVEFLAGLRLATRDAYKEKELEIQEKVLRADAVASAYIAAGRLDRLSNDVYPDAVVSSAKLVERVERCDVFEKEEGAVLLKKHSFLSQLKLTQVSPQYKEGYEKTWKIIMKERNRRYGNKIKESSTLVPNIDFNPNNTLQLLTEIKKCVNDNHDLIKKRLHTFCDENLNEYSIGALAEKNFSELDRLSKMADKSVKVFSSHKTRKRDLDPGFDNENIKKAVYKYYEPSVKNYPKINIPNYSKIISLKLHEDIPEASTVAEDQQNLMGQLDEPAVMTCEERTKEAGCQANDGSWPGLDALRKIFREFDAGRKKEIDDLHKRNTALRVEGALITRTASRESDRARALLAERRNIATEEGRLSLSIQKLYAAIDAVRKC